MSCPDPGPYPVAPNLPAGSPSAATEAEKPGPCVQPLPTENISSPAPETLGRAGRGVMHPQTPTLAPPTCEISQSPASPSRAWSNYMGVIFSHPKLQCSFLLFTRLIHYLHLSEYYIPMYLSGLGSDITPSEYSSLTSSRNSRIWFHSHVHIVLHECSI